MDFGEDLISRTITYLLVFPTTFFFSGVYSESLFLALTAAAFYYARTNRWLLACILVALATLPRSQGMIIALPLLIEYLHETQLQVAKDWMEHHGFCASSDCSPGLRPLSKAEIWQLDCHVRCPGVSGNGIGCGPGILLPGSCDTRHR
jgi:hypothetical protein